MLTNLRLWLPKVQKLRMIDIGCGIAEEADELLHTGSVTEFVGVDLDETAILQAQQRLPSAIFLCADAVDLVDDYSHYFHAVLIRRPDLFAQPAHWKEVFAVLAQLLRAEGRILVTLIGEAEAALAQKWMEEFGLTLLNSEMLPTRSEAYLLVADLLPAASEKSDEPGLTILEPIAGEGMYCDPMTGVCSTEDTLMDKRNEDVSDKS